MERYEVTIEIGANASKYWALLAFKDQKGREHKREVRKDRPATANENYLVGLTEAYKVLKTPCMVTVCCGSDHIAACFSNGWVQDWEKHEWKNKKGKTVRNAEAWQELRKAMAPHSTRVIYRRVYGD